MALKNSDVGRRRHQPARRARRDATRRAARRRFYGVSPAARRSAGGGRRATGCRSRSGTDVALMLALVHTLRRRRICAIAISSIAIPSASTCSNAICSAAMTARPRTRHGRPPSPAFPPTTIVGARAACCRPAHPDHGLAFAAARRTWRAAGLDGRGARGHARPDRPARRRICLRARRDRPHRHAAPWRCRCRRCRRARTASPTSSRSRASADMLLNPGQPFDYNGRTMRPTPTSGWSIGPAAIRSIITRISTGCARAFATSRYDRRARAAPGRRPRDIRRHRAAGDHDAGARGYRRSRHRSVAGRDAARRSSRSARRATTTIFLPIWPSAWAPERPLRKAATSASGWTIFTSRRGARLPMPAATRPTSTNSGERGELALPPAAR